MAAFSKDDKNQLPPSGDAEGDRLGPYRILRQIGRGGQATVYLAEDTRLHRQVALKVLDPGPAAGQKAFERFRREAEITSKLDHPGICAVYETGEARGSFWIAMRYIEGESLAKEISTALRGEASARTSFVGLEDPEREGGAPPSPHEGPPSSGPKTPAEIARLLALFEQAARALHAAHEHGVIHRDIKPGNIMVTRAGDPVILDFGLAQEVEGDHPALTLTGELMGTPAYMSPEQIAAQRIRLDCRTDVYSLGVSLYECLTLIRPFDAPTREGLYQAILTKDVPDVRHLNRSVSKDVKVVLETALEKDRDRRYRTALSFAEDLARIRKFEPILARPAGPIRRAVRWSQRNPARATLAASFFVVALAAAGLIGYAASQRHERETLLAAEHRSFDALLAAGDVEQARAALGRAIALGLEPATRSADLSRLAAAEKVEDERRAREAAAERQRQIEDHDRKWNEMVAVAPKITARTGHSAPLTSVAVSPDRKRAVTCALDGTARVFDVTTGEELLVLSHGSGHPTSSAFSPDGALVCTGAADGKLHVWDAISGTPVAEFAAHDAQLVDVWFVSDSNQLASIDETGRISLWDAARGFVRRALAIDLKSAGRPAVSADGSTIAVPGQEVVEIWSVRAGTKQSEVPVFASDEPDDRLMCLSASGDLLLGVTREGGVSLFDTRTRRSRWSVQLVPIGGSGSHGPGRTPSWFPRWVDLSLDATRALVALPDRNFVLLDAKDGTEIGRWKPREANWGGQAKVWFPTKAWFCADPNVVIASSEQVGLYDLTQMPSQAPEGRGIRPGPTFPAVYGVTPDRQMAILVPGSPIDSTTRSLVRSLATRDRNHPMVALVDCRIVYDDYQKQPLSKLLVTRGGGPEHSTSRNRRWHAITDGRRSWVLSAETGVMTPRVIHGHGSLAGVSEDGNAVLVDPFPSWVGLRAFAFDTQTGNEIRGLLPPFEATRSASEVTQGDLKLTWSNRSRGVTVSRVRDNARLCYLRRNSETELWETPDIALAPDGNRVVMTEHDTVSVFELPTGRRELMFPFEGTETAFSRDGRMAATGSAHSAQIRVWVPDDGRVLGHFSIAGTAGDDQASPLGFAGDDSLLWIAVSDGAIRLVRWKEGRVLLLIDARTGIRVTPSGVYAGDGTGCDLRVLARNESLPLSARQPDLRDDRAVDDYVQAVLSTQGEDPLPLPPQGHELSPVPAITAASGTVEDGLIHVLITAESRSKWPLKPELLKRVVDWPSPTVELGGVTFQDPSTRLRGTWRIAVAVERLFPGGCAAYEATVRFAVEEDRGLGGVGAHSRWLVMTVPVSPEVIGRWLRSHPWDHECWRGLVRKAVGPGFRNNPLWIPTELTEKCRVLRDLVDVLPDDAYTLNTLAWSLVDPDADARGRDVDLGLSIARRAARLSPKPDPEILHTLARALFEKGHVEEAVTTAEQALALVREEGPVGAPSKKEPYERTLAKFRAGAETRDAAGGAESGGAAESRRKR